MEFILGKPQSQKSIVLQKMALEAANKNPFGSIWYFVPEQYTLQMQRELIRQNNNKGLLNIEVLSFNRLVYRLQNELQTAGKTVLRASGKAALIYRIISENPQQFPVLAKKRNSMAFMQNLAAMMTECYQYRMTPEKLREISEGLSGEMIRDKTKDLAELLAQYQEAIKAEYFMVEAALAEVSQVLKSMDLSEVEIFVDGFYGFIPMQVEILSTFIHRAKDVHIAFPYGAEDKKALGLEDLRYPSELYYDVKNSIRKLRDTYLAETERIRIIDTPIEGVSAGILKIQNELFQTSTKPEAEKIQHIHLAEAGTVEEEIRYVAEEILDYIYKRGYRFSEIAVLVGNLEEYADKVKRLFQEYHLTYFLDKKEKIKNHPLLLFMESALMVVKSGFRYEEVMQHLKNIYIYPDITDTKQKKEMEQEIGILDIYALERGLHGKRGYLEYEPMSDNLRAVFADLAVLEKALKRKTGFREKLDALQQYLESRRVFANVEQQIADFEGKSEWLNMSEYRQAKEKLQEYFAEMREFIALGPITRQEDNYAETSEGRQAEKDHMNKDLAEEESAGEEQNKPEEMSLSDFISVLLSGMQELEYAGTPPVPDQIVVGSLEHTRLSKTKVVFAMGLSEGNVPSIQSGSGFYSDWERQVIKTVGKDRISLAEDQKTSIFKAQLTIFMSLLNATEELYFSFAGSGANGKNVGPANLFYQICRMFPHNPVKNLSLWWKEHQKVTYPLPTLHSFLKQLHAGGENSDFLPIYRSLCRSEVEPAMKRLVEPMFVARENISSGLADRLYQNQRRMSISRLESFSSCPFLHFIRYGIRAREIVPYQAARVDMGVFLHKVMETVFSLCQKQRKQIYELSGEEYERILEEAVSAGLSTDKRRIFDGNARNRFLAQQLTEIANRAVRISQKQLQQGEMSFYKEEIRFRPENMANLRFFTEDGTEFYLEGVIDRMDIGKEGDTVYFSVLDYKTSEHNLDYTEIFYGLQLQLLIYLKAGEQYLQSEGRSIVAKPVSAAYFHLKNPLFGQSDLAEETLPQDQDFLKAMRLKGVFVAENLAKMDKDLEAGSSSLVMNVRLKNDGTPYSNAMVLSQEELKELEDFAKNKAEEIAGKIWRGGTEITPYYYEKTTPCDYCSYSGICKVDLKKNSYRFLQKKGKEDLLGEMQAGKSQRET